MAKLLVDGKGKLLRQSNGKLATDDSAGCCCNVLDNPVCGSGCDSRDVPDINTVAITLTAAISVGGACSTTQTISKTWTRIDHTFPGGESLAEDEFVYYQQTNELTGGTSCLRKLIFGGYAGEGVAAFARDFIADPEALLCSPGSVHSGSLSFAVGFGNLDSGGGPGIWDSCNYRPSGNLAASANFNLDCNPSIDEESGAANPDACSFNFDVLGADGFGSHIFDAFNVADTLPGRYTYEHSDAGYTFTIDIDIS